MVSRSRSCSPKAHCLYQPIDSERSLSEGRIFLRNPATSGGRARNFMAAKYAGDLTATPFNLDDNPTDSPSLATFHRICRSAKCRPIVRYLRQSCCSLHTLFKESASPKSATLPQKVSAWVVWSRVLVLPQKGRSRRVLIAMFPRAER